MLSLDPPGVHTLLKSLHWKFWQTWTSEIWFRCEFSHADRCVPRCVAKQSAVCPVFARVAPWSLDFLAFFGFPCFFSLQGVCCFLLRFSFPRIVDFGQNYSQGQKHVIQLENSQELIFPNMSSQLQLGNSPELVFISTGRCQLDDFRGDLPPKFCCGVSLNFWRWDLN